MINSLLFLPLLHSHILAKCLIMNSLLVDRCHIEWSQKGFHHGCFLTNWSVLGRRATQCRSKLQVTLTTDEISNDSSIMDAGSKQRSIVNEPRRAEWTSSSRNRGGILTSVSGDLGESISVSVSPMPTPLPSWGGWGGGHELLSIYWTSQQKKTNI